MKPLSNILDASLTSRAFARRLWGGVLFLNIFVVVLAGIWLGHAREQDVQTAGIATRNLARVLEHHFAGSIRGIDLTLTTVAEEYARRHKAAHAFAPAEFDAFVQRQHQHLPEVDSLRVADAAGFVRYGAGVAPGSSVNIADRDFFMTARSAANPKLVIAKPVFARISQKWVLVFARRLQHADGTFAGIVYANLSLDEIVRMFSTINVGARGSITLRDGDLGVIVRHPEPQGQGSSVGNRNVSAQFRGLIASGAREGTFAVPSGLDGIERIFSFRALGEYPLYVIVGLAHAEFLSDWRFETRWVSTLLVLFLLLSLLTARLLFKAWQQQATMTATLRAQEMKFHMLADLTYDWEYWLGPDQREIVYMTPSCERITGHAQREFMEDPDLLRRIVHPEDTAIVARHMTYFNHQDDGAIDFRIRTRAGATRWIAHVCRPVHDDAGHFLGRRVSNRDITDRKHMESALRETEERLRSTFESAAIGMALVSSTGRFIEVNQAVGQIVGYTTEELLAKTFQEITHPDDLAMDLAQAEQLAAGNIASYQMEKRYIRKDGQPIWALLTGSAVRDERGALLYFIAQIQDITARKRMEETLKRSEERLKEAQQIAHLGSWELDIATRELTWSDETLRIFEFDPRTMPPSYDAFLAAIHPDDRERVRIAYDTSVRHRLPYEIVHRIQTPDGDIKHVQEHCETIYDPSGAPLRSIGTVQDVTLRILAEQSLKESEERFRTIADYTYDWEYWQGAQGEILYMSPSCKRVSGYSEIEFISNPRLLVDIVHPDDRAAMGAHIAHPEDTAEDALDFRIVRKDGEIRWIAHGCRSVHDADGRFRGRRASNRDITDRKAAEAEIQRLAYFDTLTGLPNRRMLIDRMEQALSLAKRHERSLALLFLDLDHFKHVNDSLGHDIGDALLCEVAERLKTCVRTGDTVCRQGGDEFIIVLSETAQPEDAARVAEKIVKRLGEPILVAGHALEIGVSVGIAVYPVNGSDDVQELLKKADLAMYAAKAAGRNGYRFFAPD